MKAFIKVLQDLGLLVARLILGVILVAHGWQRLTHGIDSTIGLMQQAGLPEPVLFAWGATVLELVGGGLLVFGLLTPIVAAFIAAEQVMVIVWLRWQNGLWQVSNGIEYPAVMAALALIFVVFGSGRTGVDMLLRRGKKPVKTASYSSIPYNSSTSSTV